MSKTKLLLKPLWTVKELCAYFEFKKTKGYEVAKIIKKKYGGSVPNEPKYIKRDSALVWGQTSIERELYISNLYERRNEP